MPRIRLVLEYDGTEFVGWQVQANGRSVQAVVEKALAVLLGEPVATRVAGRTDSGVHAVGQVIAFDCPRALPIRAFERGLNGLLPRDVAVREAQVAKADFDPRYHADGKHYRYLISNTPAPSPLRRLTHWEVFAPLDAARMHEAGLHLVGRHDFSAFRAADCDAAHAVRELKSVTVVREGDVLEVHVKGTAFLKHMVRNVVGSLVEVGKGKQPPSWLEAVLRSRDRGQAGVTAPPQGLTLMQVFYEGKRESRG